MTRALPCLLLAALFLPSPTARAEGRITVDDALLLRAAPARALPAKLSPPREAALRKSVDLLQRGEKQAGLAVFDAFARSYFGPTTGEDLEPIVLNVLRRAYLEPRPRLLELSERAAWLDERALVVDRHLDQLDEALAHGRKGRLQPVAGLELGGLEPEAFGEPYRWLKPRPMREGDLRRQRRGWEKRRVAAQEDAIAAHLRLQAEIQAERDAVRTLSRIALALLDSGERALARGR